LLITIIKLKIDINYLIGTSKQKWLIDDYVYQISIYETDKSLFKFKKYYSFNYLPPH